MAKKTHALSAGGRVDDSGWKTALVSSAHTIENVIGACCRAILLVTGLALLVILTLTTVLRYSYGVSIDSASEISALLFPVFVMAGIVEAARQGGHVATQILLNALNDTWRVRLVLLIHAVTAAIYLYLTWYAYQNAVIAHDEGSTILRVPGSVGYGSLAMCLALVGICSLAAIVRHALGGEKVTVSFIDNGPGVV